MGICRLRGDYKGVTQELITTWRDDYRDITRAFLEFQWETDDCVTRARHKLDELVTKMSPDCAEAMVSVLMEQEGQLQALWETKHAELERTKLNHAEAMERLKEVLAE